MSNTIKKDDGTLATYDEVEGMFQKKLASKDAENARAMYIVTKMPDLPAAYSAHMPATADQSLLYAGEQEIRKQYRDDMKIHAPKFVGQGAPPPTASTPPMDISKLSTWEKIQLGFARQNGKK